MAVHALRTLAETAAGYAYSCECGARGQPDPDRQYALDAYEAHAAQQDSENG